MCADRHSARDNHQQSDSTSRHQSAISAVSRILLAHLHGPAALGLFWDYQFPPLNFLTHSYDEALLTLHQRVWHAPLVFILHLGVEEAALFL